MSAEQGADSSKGEPPQCSRSFSVASAVITCYSRCSLFGHWGSEGRIGAAWAERGRAQRPAGAPASALGRRADEELGAPCDSYNDVFTPVSCAGGPSAGGLRPASPPGLAGLACAHAGRYCLHRPHILHRWIGIPGRRSCTLGPKSRLTSSAGMRQQCDPWGRPRIPPSRAIVIPAGDDSGTVLAHNWTLQPHTTYWFAPGQAYSRHRPVQSDHPLRWRHVHRGAGCRRRRSACQPLCFHPASTQRDDTLPDHTELRCNRRQQRSGGRQQWPRVLAGGSTT